MGMLHVDCDCAIIIIVIFADVNIGGGVTVSIGGGVTRYYAVPFTLGGITLRLDVSVGYIICYASDTIRNPGPGNYVWLVSTRGYADGFIDPAQFGRSGTRYIYVALVGSDPTNTFVLNSTIGNFSSQGDHTINIKFCVHMQLPVDFISAFFQM